MAKSKTRNRKNVIMPDITMCNGQGCDLASTCYRYKAEPSLRQTYFTEAPIEDEQCDYYIELKE